MESSPNSGVKTRRQAKLAAVDVEIPAPSKANTRKQQELAQQQNQDSKGKEDHLESIVPNVDQVDKQIHTRSEAKDKEDLSTNNKNEQQINAEKESPQSIENYLEFLLDESDTEIPRANPEEIGKENNPMETVENEMKTENVITVTGLRLQQGEEKTEKMECQDDDKKAQHSQPDSIVAQNKIALVILKSDSGKNSGGISLTSTSEITLAKAQTQCNIIELITIPDDEQEDHQSSSSEQKQVESNKIVSVENSIASTTTKSQNIVEEDKASDGGIKRKQEMEVDETGIALDNSLSKKLKTSEDQSDETTTTPGTILGTSEQIIPPLSENEDWDGSNYMEEALGNELGLGTEKKALTWKQEREFFLNEIENLRGKVESLLHRQMLMEDFQLVEFSTRFRTFFHTREKLLEMGKKRTVTNPAYVLAPGSSYLIEILKMVNEQADGELEELDLSEEDILNIETKLQTLKYRFSSSNQSYENLGQNKQTNPGTSRSTTTVTHFVSGFPPTLPHKFTSDNQSVYDSLSSQSPPKENLFVNPFYGKNSPVLAKASNKSKKRRVTCEVCHIEMNASLLRKQHMNYHIGAVFMCPICKKGEDSHIRIAQKCLREHLNAGEISTGDIEIPCYIREEDGSLRQMICKEQLDEEHKLYMKKFRLLNEEEKLKIKNNYLSQMSDLKKQLLMEKAQLTNQEQKEEQTNSKPDEGGFADDMDIEIVDVIQRNVNSSQLNKAEQIAKGEKIPKVNETQETILSQMEKIREDQASKCQEQGIGLLPWAKIHETESKASAFRPGSVPFPVPSKPPISQEREQRGKKQLSGAQKKKNKMKRSQQQMLPQSSPIVAKRFINATNAVERNTFPEQRKSINVSNSYGRNNFSSARSSYGMQMNPSSLGEIRKTQRFDYSSGSGSIPSSLYSRGPTGPVPLFSNEAYYNDSPTNISRFYSDFGSRGGGRNSNNGSRDSFHPQQHHQEDEGLILRDPRRETQMQSISRPAQYGYFTAPASSSYSFNASSSGSGGSGYGPYSSYAEYARSVLQNSRPR